jgi:hypothetical protein
MKKDQIVTETKPTLQKWIVGGKTYLKEDRFTFNSVETGELVLTLKSCEFFTGTVLFHFDWLEVDNRPALMDFETLGNGYAALVFFDFLKKKPAFWKWNNVVLDGYSIMVKKYDKLPKLEEISPPQFKEILTEKINPKTKQLVLF